MVCSDQPSHILVPATHRNRIGIYDIFQREMPDISPERRPAASDGALRRELVTRAFIKAGINVRIGAAVTGYGPRLVRLGPISTKLA
jgi:L-lactate dehydrogenase complex protein LldF